MAAAPTQNIPLQFQIEVGPWNANTGSPNRIVNATPMRTNSTYSRYQLMPGVTPGIPVGIMFSPHGFFTKDFEMPENERCVWLVNLMPIKIQMYNYVPTAADVPGGPVHRTGCYWWMKWNQYFVLENEANQRVMIRVVDLIPQPPSSPPPMHQHKVNPIKNLTPVADMPDLLSRLHTLTI